MLMAVVLLSASALSATSALQLDLETLTEKSELIIVGTVNSRECRWDAAKAGIWTHHDVTVSETLKGTHEAKRDVVIRGGVVGEIGQHVSGAGNLEDGAKYVFFLWKDDDGRYRLQGMIQGAFKVSEVEGVEHAKNSLSGLTLVDPDTMQPRKDEAAALEYTLTELKKNVAKLTKEAE
jgi:hypothetical protein